MSVTIDPGEAKEAMRAYTQKKGVLAFGVVDVDLVEKIAPPVYGPRDIFPRAKSVISIGVGGGTQGAWAADARTLAYIGDTETAAYKAAYGLAFFIEKKYQKRAIFCPPDMDPEKGARTPMQSLKLHAELAGIGARSMAGDILLHPEFGMMYYASVFTEMELPPDAPMAENPCPHPSCVKLYEKSGQTPCMRFCPVDCLSGSVDENGKLAEMHYDSHACAAMSQQYEAIPNVLLDMMDAKDPIERGMAVHSPENQMIWYKLSIGAGELLSLCYECMRVCPITQSSVMATAVARKGGMRKKVMEAEAQALAEQGASVGPES